MKILMVIPALGEVYGGPSKSVIELAEAVANLKVNVDIVTTNANGNITLKSPLFTWVTHNNYRVKYFPYLNILDYKFSWSLTKWLFHHVDQYDLVHTHAIFSYPLLPAYWSCQIKKIPYIATPHGMLEPWALAYKSGKKKLYFQYLEKPALEKANAINMLASSEAKRIQNLNLKPPLVIISNGIHRKDFENLPEAEIFYENFPHTRNKTLIIFLGRIDPKKGLDLLAKAFATVYQQFHDTHLIVAGPDNINFSSTAKNFFIDAGCGAAVTFTGMLSGNIKLSALAAASIYVAPSYSEGFSISILEGMAAGLPCVITTGCNFPEAGEAKVACVVDIDSEQIANALVAYLHDLSQASYIGSLARKFILDNYTWECIAKKMVAAYQQIVNNNQ